MVMLDTEEALFEPQNGTLSLPSWLVIVSSQDRNDNDNDDDDDDDGDDDDYSNNKCLRACLECLLLATRCVSQVDIYFTLSYSWPGAVVVQRPVRWCR